MSKGYTLIEILVGLTIISLLFSMGFVSYRDFSRRQALNGAAKTVQGDLRLTQQQALSGQKPDDGNCNTPNLLNGYNFRVDSSSSYAVEAACSGGGGTNVEVKSVDLPSGVSISTPSPNPILFKVLGQGTNIASGGSAVVTLTQTGVSSPITITITAGGEIK